MATTQEKWQEIANRGLQDKFDAETRARFDEAVRRGLITLPKTEEEQLMEAAPTMRDIVAQSIASDVGPVESFLIGAGRGMTNIARGIGLAEPEDPIVTRTVGALQEQRPVTSIGGEIVGEAAPFLAPGMAVGGIASLPARIAASTTLGATEGGIISAGKGGEAEDIATGAGVGGVIAGSLEAIFPKLSSLSSAVYRRVKGAPPSGALIDNAGRPTMEMQEALADAGLSFDDLVAESQKQLAQESAGAVPEQAARQALFAQEGVPLTRGELTQEFAQQADEARLLESAADKVSDPLRSFKLAQSEAIDKSLRSAIPVEALDSTDVGESIKDALVNRRDLLKSQKTALYKEAAENAENTMDIPIVFGAVSEQLPDAAKQRRIGRIAPAQKEALDDLMTEFGIIDDAEALLKFEEAGGEITPLSLRNFEDFRQAINQIERSDTSGAIKVISGPLKDALDTEIDMLAETLQKSGISNKSIIEPLKEARKTVRRLKTEFSPQAVTGRLIDAKRDGVTPVIEASRAYKEMLKAPEFTQRTIKSLRDSGEKGRQAISDIQSAVVLDLLDAGFGTQSRKIQGKRVFNPNAFNRRLDAIGSKQLESIFSTNKALGNKLKNMRRISEDLQPPAGAVPKGSASVILDQLNRLGITAIGAKIPGIQIMQETLQNIAESNKSRAQVERALTAIPEQLEMARLIDQQFPSLASSLGIVGISQIQDDEQ